MQSPYVDDAVLNKVRQVKDPHAFSIYHVVGLFGT